MTRRNTLRGRRAPAWRPFRRVAAPIGPTREVDTGAARRQSPAMPLARVIMAVAGVALAAITLWDAFESVLVPRRISRRVRLTRYFYIVTWRVWRALARGIRKPSRRESLLGFYGPISLILLLVCWAAGLIVAFALLQIVVLPADELARVHFRTMLYLSGETFFTLGFGDITPSTAVGRVLSVLEAGMGFAFLGTVVGYLPTMYGAFSQREIAISLLDARAGSPPTAAELLGRTHVSSESARESTLREWERWAAQLLETHISYPQLAYYRSQHSNQSWLAALTVILDACALVLAGSEAAIRPQAKLTFAMARHALVDVMQIFVTRYTPGAPDRLPRAEFARLQAHLERSGVGLAASAGFEQRLAALRLTYEPYAQALAAVLLFELPPWIAAAPRHDNWRRGPWDSILGVPAALEETVEEHF